MPNPPPPPDTPRQNDGTPTADVPDAGEDIGLPENEEGSTCSSANIVNAPGNPIFAGTGNKYQREVDYVGPGVLSLVRHYNSGLKTWVHNYMMRIRAGGGTAIAVRPDGKTLVFNGAGAGAWTSNATVVETLVRLNATSPGDPAWKLVTGADTVEWYDANGLPILITYRGGRSVRLAYSGWALQSVTDDFGRALAFAYDSRGRLAEVAAPGGEAMRYGYGANGHLGSVTYADGTSRQYLYENPSYPYALTGLIDQNGNRFATWRYDARGRAVGSEHAGGVERFALDFDASSAGVVVTDPLGVQRLLQHQNVAGRQVFAGSSLPCTDCRGNAAGTVVNAVGKVTQATDFSGVASQYTYDEARKLPVSQTRAAGTQEAQSRVVEWHPSLRLPLLVGEPGRTTAYEYDSRGNTLSQTVTDTATGQRRTVRWSYTSQGLMETMTDAKGSLWRFGYDAAGNRTSVTDPLGRQTAYTFDAAGRVLTQTDPNGLVTAHLYDVRGRLISLATGGETRTYTYTPAGQLASATLPNGVQVTYAYDAAQRLVSIADNRGASITYTLDAMGNRIREEVRDANGNLALTTARVIDSLNRVAAVQGAQGQATGMGYDANGEPFTVTDPLNQTTRQTLDALRRPTATIFADNNSARQAWSALDALVQVTDPKGVATQYERNAFGEVMKETSPDIGSITYTRDANGAVVTTQDAKGQITKIERDALGRPTRIEYAPGFASTFAYDAAGNVSRMDDSSGSTVYARDAQGRVLSKTQTVQDNPPTPSAYAVQYGYAAGDLASITYPSGLKVTYRRVAGRITGIDVQPPAKGGKVQPAVAFLSGLTHTALGAPKAWSWVNGDGASRTFDADGRMVASEIATYGYDAAGRVTSVTQNLWATDTSARKPAPYQVPITWTAGYDSRNRLTSFARTGSSSTYTYDANSNRLTSVETATSDSDLDGQFDSDPASQTVTRRLDIEATSNRLLGYTPEITTTGIGAAVTGGPVTYGLDANGALTKDAVRSYVYDASNRLAKTQVMSQGDTVSVNYWHNALGQRVFKSEPQAEALPPGEKSLTQGFVKWLQSTFGWTLSAANAKSTTGMAYVYDEQWNLIGEYDNGTVQGRGNVEYIWLPTEARRAIPVGIYRSGGLYAVHSDHLGTPRLITDAQKAVVWQWPYSAFGSNRPIGVLAASTGSGTAKLRGTSPTVEMNLRYPGQYFDSESGWNYNGFRSYEPKMGVRYTQPDPTGLRGGSNRFAYVGAAPLTYIDPLGLEKLILLPKEDINFPAAAAAPDVPGQLVIYSHGNPNKVAGKDAQGLADLIKQSGMWKDGMPIKLDACRTAEGASNIAKDLARVLRTNVTGADSRTLTFGDKDLGAWRSFSIPGTERAIPYWPGS
nr:RHS repeat-associated core domain-containing protein [Caenimonas aquaedulcis]